jgi:type IX secretion system PorP/SprF family membrane protein
MKIKILFIYIFIQVTSIEAQQRMLFSSQQQQGFMQNPALVGLEDYREVKLIYHQQWTGFEGSPTLKGIGYSTLIGKDSSGISNKLKSLPLPGTKPKLFSESTSKNKRNSKNKKGFGAVIMTESDGTISITDYMSMFSFQFERNKKTWLLGIGAGMLQYSFNPDNLRLVNSNDLTFSKQQRTILMPSLQLSAAYMANDFFVCVNSKHSFKTNILNDASRSELLPNTFISGGLKFKLLEHLTVVPSALIRITKNTPNTADISGLLDYKDLLRFGVLYRTNGDFSASAGITYNHSLSVLYSFDLTTSQLRSIYSNTHNIILSFRIRKTALSTNLPRNFWF